MFIFCDILQFLFIYIYSWNISLGIDTNPIYKIVLTSAWLARELNDPCKPFLFICWSSSSFWLFSLCCFSKYILKLQFKSSLGDLRCNIFWKALRKLEFFHAYIKGFIPLLAVASANVNFNNMFRCSVLAWMQTKQVTMK